MGHKICLEEEHKATGIKLFLSPITESHTEHLIRLARDPSLTDLMGWNTCFEPHETEKFIEEVANYALPYSQKSQPIVFGVYLDPEDLPIGYVALKGLNTNLLTAEISVAILDKRYRNKGHGRLALKRMIAHGFDDLGIQTIAAAILASNQSSINMVKRLGFSVKEVMEKSWVLPNGERADMLWVELRKS